LLVEEVVVVVEIEVAEVVLVDFSQMLEVLL
jgi:hypothetical protein